MMMMMNGEGFKGGHQDDVNAEKATEYSFLVDKTSHPTVMKSVKPVDGVIVFKNARCFKNKITVLIELH